MSYNYNSLKPYTLTDKGSVDVIRVKDFMTKSIKATGAVMMNNIMFGVSFNTCESWEMLACVDRVLEVCPEFEEIPKEGAGQHRIFVNYGL